MNTPARTPITRAIGQAPGWNQNAAQAPTGAVVAVQSHTPVPVKPQIYNSESR